MEIENRHKEYSRTETTIYSCQYHVIFCPKYRRPVLVDGIDEALKRLILENQERGCYKIYEMEVMPDHVHLLMELPPTDVPRNVITRLKGYTAHELRRMFPKLKSRLPSLWTRSCFIASVGAITLEVVNRYIEEQKGV